MAVYRNLIAWILIAGAALASGTSCWAQAAAVEESPADPLAALQQRVERMSQQISEQLQALDQAVKLLQERLGESFGRPSAFNTIEKRLEDIEKRLDELERDFDDMERELRRLDRDR